MISVAFVCLGNICRSPMGEAIFKRMAEEEGLAHLFTVSSFGTSDEEEGNPVYLPARRTLETHGIVGFTHRAKQLTLSDVKNNDYILVMDDGNMFDVIRLTAGRYGEKIFKLGYFCTPQFNVDDPWYTRDFERAYREIYSGCAGFMEYIKINHANSIDYARRRL